MTFLRRLTPILDFERPSSRLAAALLVLAAAIVSPNIDLPGSLPVIRLDQLGLLVFLVPLVLYLKRHPEARHIGLVDFGFGALIVAITLTILLSPFLIKGLSRSPKDAVELMRPVLFWLMYRLARTCDPTDRTAFGGLGLLWVISIPIGVFALAQTLGPSGFNTTVTSLWAVGHNLDGVVRGGRAVGTMANADAFSLLAVAFAMAALWSVLLRVRLDGWRRYAIIGGFGMAVLDIVFAQSRGAIVAALGALVLGVIVVAVSRRPTRWLVSGLMFAVCVSLSLGALSLAPSQAQAAQARFNVGGLAKDSSVILRAGRLKLLFGGPGEPAASVGLCSGSVPASTGPGHSLANAPAASSNAASARDAQRKADVAAIAAALNASFCSSGQWPASDAAVATALAGAGLSTAPVDPATREPYSIQSGANGYVVSATLETPGDPDGPTYVASSSPNVILDSGFEGAGGDVAEWQWDSGSTATTAPTGRFGSHSAAVKLSPDGWFTNYVVYTLAPSTDYAMSVWLRSTDGAAHRIQLSASEILADGSRVSPACADEPTLPADGSWVRASCHFVAPAKGLVYVEEFAIETLPGDGGASIAVDGATFTAGTLAPAYALTRDVDPSRIASGQPSFLQSPIVGLGPPKDYEIGGDPGEYVLILLRYGALGLLAYLILFIAAAVAALKVWRASTGAVSALALTALTMTAAGSVFAATTPSYFNNQMMYVYWLLIGLAVAAGTAKRSKGPAPVDSVAAEAQPSSPAS
jgi:hypothetical protein